MIKSPYSQAMKELGEIKENNKVLLNARRREVYLKVPRIAEIDASLRRAGVALSRCVLSKGKNFDAIKSDIIALQREKEKLLIENNLSRDELEERFNCEKCRDTGFIGHERCVCLQLLIAKNLSKSSNLTEVMKHQTFENIDLSLFADTAIEDENASPLDMVKRVVNILLDFAKTFDKTHQNLLIQGGTGTGKTFLTSCVANYALDRKLSVFYQPAYKLFEIVDNVKFNRGENAHLLLDYAYEADLLIIDDLGTEFITSISTAAFFDIMDSRLRRQKSTIINTNLDFGGLEDIYSSRVTSRLIGEYRIINLIGEDLRVNKTEGA